MTEQIQKDLEHISILLLAASVLLDKIPHGEEKSDPIIRAYDLVCWAKDIVRYTINHPTRDGVSQLIYPSPPES